MSKFTQRHREAMKDPVYAAAYREADRIIELRVAYDSIRSVESLQNISTGTDATTKDDIIEELFALVGAEAEQHDVR